MTIGVPRRKVQQHLADVTTIPAPTRGIDVRQPAAFMAPENCYYTYNLMPSEYGMLIRKGYREWETGVDAGNSVGVSTLITYESVESATATNRLFAVTSDGIWDVTTYDAPPILKIAFAITTPDAGNGTYCHYVDGAGEEYLMYADALNGLFEYVESTDTWQVPTGIIGPVIADINFVVVHKQRMWLIEEDSTHAWYLPVGSKSGQATEFYFGSKFPHGGKLNGLYNWTLDGGAGLDDILVAVASSGDVIPYQGADPSSADTWSNIGTYYIGKTPKGRNTVSEYAGNLYLLSAYGILAMSDLTRGIDVKNVAEASLSFKVSRPLRQDLLAKGSLYGWALEFVPAIGSLVVTVPKTTNFPDTQYVMSLTTEAWGFWRGVPALSLAEWGGDVYLGTLDNRICIMDIYRDDVKLIPPVGDNGHSIEFSLMTSAQRYGSDGRFKQVQYIRPDFWSAKAPIYYTKPRYDYNTEEIASLNLAPLVPPDIWDSSEWDKAVWSGGEGEGNHELLGGGGIGRSVSVALKGEATNFIRLLSFDIVWTTGGAA